VITLLLLLALAQDPPAPSYEDLVAQGLARGREGHLDEAGQAFDRAIALDPGRAEAFVERGGLRFLEKNYDAAIRDLEQALRRRSDPYTRDLLASALHLAGRSDEALGQWNVLGQPTLQSLEITGLEHTKDRVARRELSVAEGSLLSLDDLRASRARLREVGVFDRVTLRPVPRGEGKADVEVALSERYGLFATPLDFLLSSGVNALQRRVRLRYTNLKGTGVSFGGQYRWEENRPELSLAMDWPRPFGLPAYAHLQSFRGRQVYGLGESLTRKSRGIDLNLRHVFGAQTVGELGFRGRDRTFSRPDPSAEPGVVTGITGGVEQRLVDRYRQRLDVAARGFQTAAALGSELRYATSVISLTYRAFASPPDGTPIDRSVLAARVLWGWESGRAPIDDAFAPGGSVEMEFPLRAHRQTRNGTLGEMPLARSLVLGNFEWRRRFLDKTAVQLGFAAFTDVGRAARTVTGIDRSFVDVGLGLRVAFRGSSVIRIDFGHGLSDGKNALFVGLGQVF